MERSGVRSELERAHRVLERWNETHPDQWTCWEWLEEAILARQQWRWLARRNPVLALGPCQRYSEFARRLPPALIEQLRW
ncbi:MAG: hypothetical protein HY320_08290 [Armatimonadetes bacterium]|nr:hypothetical protein [Armatimonadota bacterium]